jgi:hypothetical protein
MRLLVSDTCSKLGWAVVLIFLLGSHCGFVDFKSPLDTGLEKIFARTAENF